MALPGNADGTPGSYEGKGPPSSSAATYNDKDGLTSKGGNDGVQRSSKKINSPQTAENVAVESQGELLRYPLVNNYFASMTYRMKTINPWDVDLSTAQKIFEKTLLWDLTATEKKKKDEAKKVGDPDALDPRGDQISPQQGERLKLLRPLVLFWAKANTFVLDK